MFHLFAVQQTFGETHEKSVTLYNLYSVNSALVNAYLKLMLATLKIARYHCITFNLSVIIYRIKINNSGLD